MKFVLLASGKIAEKFVIDKRFLKWNTNNLVATIATQEVNSLIKENIVHTNKIEFNVISDKKGNERELESIISSCAPDFILSIQYPWILPRSILNSVSGKILNLHNAKIPEYRGHNSISHEILNDEKFHTTTVHWMAEEVDRGLIAGTRDIQIDKNDTAFSLWIKSVESALILLDEVLFDLGQQPEIPYGYPVGEGGRYYSKNIASYKQVPLNSDLKTINKWARAFCFPPYDPAFLEYNGKKLYLLPNDWMYNCEVDPSNI